MAAAGLVTTLGVLPPFLLGAQAVWVRADLGVGVIGFGLAVSAFFAAATFGSLAGGAVLDRAGRRIGTVVAGALVACGGAAMVTLVRDLGSLVAVMVLLGLANAACQVTANLTVARALPANRRGLGFGIKQAAVPVAIMLGGLAVPTVGQAFGWRTSYGIAAAGGGLVLLVALLRRSPEPRLGAPVAGQTLDQPPLRPLVLCGLAIMLASAAVNFLGAYLATWGYQVGLTPSQAGLLIAAGSGACVLIRVATGHRADGRYGANLPIVALQMVLGAGCLGALALGQEWSVVVFGFLAFAVGWSWPGLFLFAVARVGRDAPARATAVVQAGAFAGGATGPLLLGAVVGWRGFEVAWSIAAVFCLVAALLVWGARRGFLTDLEARPPRTQLHYGGGRREPARTTRDSAERSLSSAERHRPRP